MRPISVHWKRTVPASSQFSGASISKVYLVLDLLYKYNLSLVRFKLYQFSGTMKNEDWRFQKILENFASFTVLFRLFQRTSSEQCCQKVWDKSSVARKFAQKIAKFKKNPKDPHQSILKNPKSLHQSSFKRQKYSSIRLLFLNNLAVRSLPNELRVHTSS